jgi:hypothetical protein
MKNTTNALEKLQFGAKKALATSQDLIDIEFYWKNSLSIKDDNYSTSVGYVAKKTLTNRVFESGGKYSTGKSNNANNKENSKIDETSFSLENPQQLELPYITVRQEVISTPSGCLYRYLKNIKLKSGVIASYPRIKSARNPDNINHWYWGYSYKVLIQQSWKSKSLSVSRDKVDTVKQMIETNVAIEIIRDFIKFKIE